MDYSCSILLHVSSIFLKRNVALLHKEKYIHAFITQPVKSVRQYGISLAIKYTIKSLKVSFRSYVTGCKEACIK
jgi:hypothetical protein